MRKWLILSVLVAAGLIGAADRASAGPWGPGPGTRTGFSLSGSHGEGYYPSTFSATFPALNPPGYYSNTRYYAWYYPWFAYYNYSSGPYANWAQGGGYATYGGDAAIQPYGVGLPVQHHSAATMGGEAHISEGAIPTEAPVAGTVCVTLPADAKLLFNGTAASGNGEVRTFRTAPLAHGKDYAYDLTAEVVRDGQVAKATARVIVRAGEQAKVTLAPEAVTRAAAR